MLRIFWSVEQKFLLNVEADIHVFIESFVRREPKLRSRTNCAVIFL
jgi:hypothetical protein